MKGRRKLSTFKWHFKAKIETEAREALRNRTAKQGRFLDASLINGLEDEPVGRLAG